jgi:hypothetical protein
MKFRKTTELEKDIICILQGYNGIFLISLLMCWEIL